MNINARFEEIINSLYKGNKRAFAQSVGISATVVENVVGTRKGKPSYDVLEKVCANANISAEWLLTGKGNMLNTDAREASFSEQSHGVPFYDVDFCGGFDMMVNDQSAVPTGYIDFPQYNRADSWARITGHSMEPLISNGDIIALRKVEDWQSYLLYGEIYGIMTNEYRTVKRIRKAQDPAKVLLEPINKDFDTIELDKRLIMGVWAVLGCAKKFF